MVSAMRPMDDEIDLATLEELRELEEDDGFIRELVGIYARDSAAHLEQLRVAVSHGDLVRVGTLAHALKGASRSIGAARAGDAAQALERHAHQPGEGEDTAQLLRALEQAVQRALPRIEALVSGA
jgi:HPt (histidine-containing phosphotransfer) domain-containing protein